MKKLRERTLWFITTLSIFMVVMVFVVLYNQRVLMIRQEQEIAELNQTIGEYRINEEWFEDYIDIIEDVYDGKINEAVLEERVKWLEKTNKYSETYTDLMYDDFETFIIEMIEYFNIYDDDYEAYVEWFRVNRPKIYERIESYEDR